jgi:hypothetical protein
VNGSDARGLPGFTLKSVKFSDVTGDGREDAIVVIHLDTGGTQQTDYAYIFSFVDEKPKLLAYFHSGDRAYAGLRGVYGDHEQLVIELFDPEKRQGDCCSSQFVRTRYRWHDGRFEAVGASELQTLKKP